MKAWQKIGALLIRTLVSTVLFHYSDNITLAKSFENRKSF